MALKQFKVAAALLIVLSAAAAAAAAPPTYVLHGSIAKQGQFPFTAWLSTCSASILDANTILTAAHCICNRKKLKAKIGSVYGSQTENGASWIDLDPQRQIVHPNYKRCGTIGKDDIAVIKTVSPIQFTNLVQPITLFKSATKSGDSITVSGFGRDETGKSGVLRYATNRVVDCKRYTGSVCQLMSPNSPYYGDSGGPLFVNDGGKMQQVGVVSGGDFNNNQAIYGNVFDSLKWIEGLMG